MTTNERKLIEEQIRYYRARAPEYDDWFFRRGRYDRGEEHRREWNAEAATAEAALREARPSGRILELACGTGLWTRHLAPPADEMTAVDASPEVLRLNRERVGSAHVHYIEADLFGWQPTGQYDFIFFGFWLSHVPPGRFEDFWELVAKSLKSDGQVFFVDGLFHPDSSAAYSGPVDPDGTLSERKLADGREFTIVKVFYETAPLEQRLSKLGWQGVVRSTGKYFLYGNVNRRRPVGVE